MSLSSNSAAAVGGPFGSHHSSLSNQQHINILRQLGASIICFIAAGERQAEIIRKVAFELADF